jgi:flagellar M-ring protein FliF
MAEPTALPTLSPLQLLAANPLARQLLLLVGVAAAVALGVAAVLWSQNPNYTQLHTGLSDKDAGLVIEALQKANIPARLEGGAVLVPAAKLQDARLKLATQGLPKGSENGFELLHEAPPFGTSQFLETARYQHALEGELARSIANLTNVQSARVHLALPKQSAFVRNRQPPSASVLVSLYPGRTLEPGQVAAVLHLVAAGVPGLETGRITVVDQRGRLLSTPETSQEVALSASQFEYTRKLEEAYVRRIEELLMPIAGLGAVRAQVVAEVDFTISEQTQERFNGGQPALRSEQVIQEASAGVAGAAGIPGALSNQPPAAGSTDPAKPATATAAKSDDKAKGNETSNANNNGPSNSSSRATRNYELDKTISHTRSATGAVKRLSVAVVLDDKQKTDEEGEVTRTPFTPEEIERITALVKDAVGFNKERGDTVNVINSAFNAPPPVEPPPEPPFWKQPWLWEAAKQLGAAGFVLALFFGVLRPVLRGLLARTPLPAPAGAAADSRLGLAGPATAPALAAPGNYDNQLTSAKSLAAQDPKRAAQVVKNWVANDA